MSIGYTAGYSALGNIQPTGMSTTAPPVSSSSPAVMAHSLPAFDMSNANTGYMAQFLMLLLTQLLSTLMGQSAVAPPPASNSGSNVGGGGNNVGGGGNNVGGGGNNVGGGGNNVGGGGNNVGGGGNNNDLQKAPQGGTDNAGPVGEFSAGPGRTSSGDPVDQPRDVSPFSGTIGAFSSNGNLGGFKGVQPSPGGSLPPGFNSSAVSSRQVTTTTTNPDGSVTTHIVDGDFEINKTVTTNPDGSTTTVYSNSEKGKLSYENTTIERKNADGSRELTETVRWHSNTIHGSAPPVPGERQVGSGDDSTREWTRRTTYPVGGGSGKVEHLDASGNVVG